MAICIYSGDNLTTLLGKLFELNFSRTLFLLLTGYLFNNCYWSYWLCKHGNVYYLLGEAIWYVWAFCPVDSFRRCNDGDKWFIPLKSCSTFYLLGKLFAFFIRICKWFFRRAGVFFGWLAPTSFVLVSIDDLDCKKSRSWYEFVLSSMTLIGFFGDFTRDCSGLKYLLYCDVFDAV